MTTFARLTRRAALALALALVSPTLAQTYHDTGGTAVPAVVPVSPGGGPLFTAGNPGQVATKGGAYASAGTGQYALSVASATPLTVPSGAIIAEICVEGAAVRYRDDGTAPTASMGLPVAAGTCFQYSGPLSAVQFIAQSSGSTIDVGYYK